MVSYLLQKKTALSPQMNTPQMTSTSIEDSLVYVENISYITTEDELEAFFEPLKP